MVNAECRFEEEMLKIRAFVLGSTILFQTIFICNAELGGANTALLNSTRASIGAKNLNLAVVNPGKLSEKDEDIGQPGFEQSDDVEVSLDTFSSRSPQAEILEKAWQEEAPSMIEPLAVEQRKDTLLDQPASGTEGKVEKESLNLEKKQESFNPSLLEETETEDKPPISEINHEKTLEMSQTQEENGLNENEDKGSLLNPGQEEYFSGSEVPVYHHPTSLSSDPEKDILPPNHSIDLAEASIVHPHPQENIPLNKHQGQQPEATLNHVQKLALHTFGTPVEHPSEQPSTKPAKESQKTGAARTVADLKASYEEKIAKISNNPKETDTAMMVCASLIPLMSTHIKCEESGTVTSTYHPDHKPHLEKDEGKLANSLATYVTKARNLDHVKQHLSIDEKGDEHKLSPKFVKKQAKSLLQHAIEKAGLDKQTEKLVNGKWMMVVLKFFVRSFYSLKQGLEAEKSKVVHFNGKELSVHKKVVNELKKLEDKTVDKKGKNGSSWVQKFEELTMKVMLKNLFEASYYDIDYAYLPEVDLNGFAALNPKPYLTEVPKQCKNKVATLKKANHKMCSLANLMVLALSDIVVGKHSIVVCFLNEGNFKELTETANKLHRVFVEHALHEQKELKDIEKDGVILLQIINCSWAIGYLKQLGEKYTKMQSDLPKEGEDRTKLDELYTELLALRSSVEKYYENLKKHLSDKLNKALSEKEKEHEMTDVKLDEFL